MQKRQIQCLIVGALFLLAFVLLFSFRSYDDNRLFSWQWMFPRADASLVYLLLIAALALSYWMIRHPVPEGRETAVLAATSFLAVLPFWCGPELIIDAARYFTQAKHLSQYGPVFFLQEWGRGIFAWTDLPLVPFCYGVLFKVFGESRVVIQAFTTLLFSLTAVLTFRIGRRLRDRETGLAAGALLLGMPYLLTQAPLMLVDVPTMFLLMLSLAAYLDALERGGALRSAGAVAAIVLFALSKYSAWPMLSLFAVTLPAYLFSRERADRRGDFRRGVLILAAACAVLAVLLLAKLDVLSAQALLLREYQAPGLGRWGESAVSTFLFQMHPFIALSALAGAVIAVRRRDWPFLAAGWLLLLVAMFGIRRIRYILPVFPFLALMAAYGLQALKDEAVRRFVVICIAATSLAVAFSVYLPFAQSMSTVNLLHAGAVLDGLDGREVEVIMVQSGDTVAGPVVSLALLDLHTRKELRVASRAPGPVPPAAERARSPLRFTWELPVPRYYGPASTADSGVPVVVVADGMQEKLPDAVVAKLRGYRQAASLRTGEGIFQYAPAVFVYEREGLSAR